MHCANEPYKNNLGALVVPMIHSQTQSTMYTTKHVPDYYDLWSSPLGKLREPRGQAWSQLMSVVAALSHKDCLHFRVLPRLLI